VLLLVFVCLSTFQNIVQKITDLFEKLIVCLIWSQNLISISSILPQVFYSSNAFHWDSSTLLLPLLVRQQHCTAMDHMTWLNCYCSGYELTYQRREVLGFFVCKNRLKPHLIGFEICPGFQLVDSYKFPFAPHSIEYTNICRFVGLYVSKT